VVEGGKVSRRFTEQIRAKIRITDEERHKPKFQMPTNVEVTVAAISELYLLKTIADNTDAYPAAKGRKIRAVSKAEILRFFAIVVYMGVVQLSAK
jgi:hypothetical protein